MPSESLLKRRDGTTSLCGHKTTSTRETSILQQQVQNNRPKQSLSSGLRLRRVSNLRDIPSSSVSMKSERGSRKGTSDEYYETDITSGSRYLDSFYSKGFGESSIYKYIVSTSSETEINTDNCGINNYVQIYNVETVETNPAEQNGEACEEDSVIPSPPSMASALPCSDPASEASVLAVKSLTSVRSTPVKVRAPKPIYRSEPAPDTSASVKGRAQKPIPSSQKNQNEGDKVSVSKDKNGAIYFKIPGRVIHKTTIKVTHFPHGTSEIVNISEPIHSNDQTSRTSAWNSKART